MLLLTPLVKQKKGQHEQLLQRLRKDGFVRVRVDGEIRQLSERSCSTKNKHHYIEAVVDRLALKPSVRRRLDESVSTAVALGAGTMLAAIFGSWRRRCCSAKPQPVTSAAFPYPTLHPIVFLQ